MTSGRIPCQVIRIVTWPRSPDSGRRLSNPLTGYHRGIDWDEFQRQHEAGGRERQTLQWEGSLLSRCLAAIES